MVGVENRIRTKLTGGTPKQLTLVLEKMAQVEGDEWAKIFQFEIQKGKVLDQSEAVALKQRQAELRAQLNRQMADLEARKKAEKEEEIAYFHSEQVCRVKSLVFVKNEESIHVFCNYPISSSVLQIQV